MKKKRLIKVNSLFIGILLILSIFTIPVSAISTQQSTSNRFNVVFVLDASGSMKSTDPNNLRFDATKLFLGLLANDGNYVGSVVFSTNIIKTTTVSKISGNTDKKKVESDIESCDVGGWTALGNALKKGVDMLQSNGDKDLPSVIILLSDGQSELGNADDLEKCNENKAKAIKVAREKDIIIYTVGLNSDGGADMKELKQISDATKGECEEVKNASDLKNVFARFYNLIYGTSTTTLFNGKVPSNGKIKQSFDIPKAGVEEVNIIISSKSSIKNIKLDKPDGTKLSISDVKKMTTSSKSFTITKITKPDGGKWILYAEGKAGDDVKIEMVYNDCLSIKTEYDESQKYTIGTKVTVNGYLYNKDEIATEGYDDYEAILYVTKQISDNEKENIEEKIEMKTSSSSFVGEIPIDVLGTYTAYMQVVGNGIEKNTSEEPIVLNVGNTPPSVKKKKIEEHFWVIPFFTNTGDIDLSGAVTDVEDKKLKYTVESSSFKNTSYELNNETLTMTDFYDLSEGTFTIKATDSQGASAEFEVDVTTTNVGILTLILLLIIALIVIAIIVAIIILLSRKKFMGTITVQNLETGASAIQQKNKGNIKLSSFQIGNTGFSKDARFQATNKSYVEFRTSKPVLTSSTVSKSKKITIQNRCEIEIYSDDTRTKGISVVFESYLSSY